jgi:rubrerythrin
VSQFNQIRISSLPMATLADALQDAVEFERLSVRIYMDLATKVDSQVRPLLLRLVADSKADGEFLSDFAKSAELGKVPSPNLKFCLSDEASRQSVDPASLGDEPIEDDVLDYVEVREKLACNYYKYMLGQTRARPLQKLIVRLIETKSRHQEEVLSCSAALFLIF